MFSLMDRWAAYNICTKQILSSCLLPCITHSAVWVMLESLTPAAYLASQVAPYHGVHWFYLSLLNLTLPPPSPPRHQCFFNHLFLCAGQSESYKLIWQMALKTMIHLLSWFQDIVWRHTKQPTTLRKTWVSLVPGWNTEYIRNCLMIS